MNVAHQQLSQGKWQRMPLVEQMANVGSEVQRALKWKSKNNSEYSQKAFERALELLDLTMRDFARASCLKEVARVREFLVDYFMGTNQFGFTPQSWESYFLQFAVASRQNR